MKTYQCLDCDGIFQLKKSKISVRCKKCYLLWTKIPENTPMFGRVGKDHPNYKHGKTKNNKCLDCQISISPQGVRCQSCSMKKKWAEGLFKDNLPAFKTGKIIVSCAFCKKELKKFPYSVKGNNFCSKECQGKWKSIYHTGKNNPKFSQVKVHCIVCEKPKSVCFSVSKLYNYFFCSNKCKSKWTKINRSRENHYNWQGGISPLTEVIRTSEKYKNWRTICLRRDSYTCQICNKVGGKLNVDHIIAFSLIFRKFLKRYNQFSPLEDKETLLRLSMKHKPFWDTKNGRTLCVPCHEKTDNYKKQSLNIKA